MQVCFQDPTPLGFRDAALIAILRGAGLRRAEAVSLQLNHFDPSNSAIKVKSGKGEKDRTVYLPNGGIPVVLDWLHIRVKKAEVRSRSVP